MVLDGHLITRLASFLSLFVCMASSGGVANAIEATQIVIVSTPPDHPPGSHLYAEEARAMEACLSQTADVHITRIENWPPATDVLDAADALVFYSKPIGDIVLHPDHRHRFLECMHRGTGLVAIHWSTGVGYGPLADDEKLRDEFRGVLGGWFRRPPGDVRIDSRPVDVLLPDHPIVRGVKLSAARDEFYLRPVMHEAASPFLQVSIDGQDHPVGWTFERTNDAQGRSVGISLGHFHERFEDDNFRRLLTNAILWAAHREIPAEGSPLAP